MAASETPPSASYPRGQALQMEATDVDENPDDKLKVIDDGFASVKPGDFRRDDPSTVVKATVHDPDGEFSPELDSHCIAASDHVIQTGNITDQEIADELRVLQFVDEQDDVYLTNDHNFEDPLDDCDTNYNIKHKEVDEDDQVDGKSSDQNNLFPGTKATGKAESATLLQQNVDFSPTATAPNGISVPKTGDGVNLQLTVQDKEDEVNGGIVLDQMKDGTNRPSFSTFGAVNDKPAPGTGATSPTTANDVRVAVPSLEPLPKRAKVNEEGMLVNVGHTSSSSSAAGP